MTSTSVNRPSVRSLSSVIVPRRFHDAVFLHIIKNAIGFGIDIPLLLAIQGRPGDGKSFQVREVCRSHGIVLESVSAATLSSKHEGEAVRPFQIAYLTCSQQRADGRFAAVMIDDFDLSIAGVRDNTTYSVNTQILIAFFQNLCDFPENCADHNCRRVPIVLTGNDFSRLYASFVRHGRLDIFTWEPTKSEKLDIVTGIFPTLSRSDVEQLVDCFPAQPISFFRALLVDVLDTVLIDYFAKTQLPISNIDFEVESQLHHLVESRLQCLTVAPLIIAGEQRARQKIISFASPAGEKNGSSGISRA